jgi:hypothetical protein
MILGMSTATFTLVHDLEPRRHLRRRRVLSVMICGGLLVG